MLKLLKLIAGIGAALTSRAFLARTLDHASKLIANDNAFEVTRREFPEVTELNLMFEKFNVGDKRVGQTELSMHIFDALLEPCKIKTNDNWDPTADFDPKHIEPKTKDEQRFYQDAFRVTCPPFFSCSSHEALKLTAKWKDLIKACRKIDAEERCEPTAVSKAYALRSYKGNTKSFENDLILPINAVSMAVGVAAVGAVTVVERCARDRLRDRIADLRNQRSAR